MKKSITNLLLLCITVFNVNAQNVSTYTDGTPDDAIAIDSNGNIYCSNYVGDTVFKFTPSGTGTAFITGLNTPNGLEFNSNDELYVCDGMENMIFTYDVNGAQIGAVSVNGHPSGIIKSFDDESMIFTKYQGNSIHILDTNGAISLLSSAPELNGPVGLAYGDDNSLYVGNYTDRKIFKVLMNGDLEYVAQLPTDGGQMPNLGFIAFGQGMLWGTTMGSDKIYAINPNAIDEIYLFGGSTQGANDGDINQATFNTPNGIIFDNSETTMYITDFGTKNLRVISDVVLGLDYENLKKNDIVVYPVPATDLVNVSVSLIRSSAYSIVVRDSAGKKIYDVHSDKLTNEIREAIDISLWSQGFYFVEVTIDNFSMIKKFIK